MRQEKFLQWILNISIGLILFVLPFPRGLFFEKEIVPVQIGIFAVFILWSYIKIIKKEKLEIDSLLFISVALLPISYILPLIFGKAASHYGSLMYIFRYLSYLAVFIILSDITKTKRHLLIWLNILAASGIIAALLGIDAGLGGNINNFFGFAGFIDEFGRVCGVLQYSNSFAAYMGMIFFLLIALGALVEKRYQKVIYAALGVLPLTVLYMTVSRGAIIFVPVVYILLILLIPTKEKRLEIMLLSFPAIVLSLFSGKELTNMIPQIISNEGQTLILKGWLIAIAVIVVTFLFAYLLLCFHVFLAKISSKTYQIIIGILAITGLVGGAVIFKTGLYLKILPEFLVIRFKEIASITDIMSGRNNFYRDGFNMLKDHWLFGAGGNAWFAMYKQYQSYNYGSTEVHSFPLQLWLETGLIGILTFILLIAALIILYFKNRKSEKGITITLILMPVIMLFAHSTLDFNFSYFSLPVIAFSIIGCINGIKSKKDINFALGPWLTLILGIILILFPISWRIGRNYAVKATATMVKEKLTGQDVLDSIGYMKKAIEYNGWDYSYIIREGEPKDKDLVYDLDTLYKYFYDILEKNDSQQIAGLLLEQESYYNKAHELEPNNSHIRMKQSELLLKMGRIDEALEKAEEAVRLNPMNPIRYQDISQIYINVAEFYINQGEEEVAKGYLERILNIEKDIEEVNKRAIEEIAINETTKKNIERASQLLKD